MRISSQRELRLRSRRSRTTKASGFTISKATASPALKSDACDDLADRFALLSLSNKLLYRPISQAATKRHGSATVNRSADADGSLASIAQTTKRTSPVFRFGQDLGHSFGNFIVSNDDKRCWTLSHQNQILIPLEVIQVIVQSLVDGLFDDYMAKRLQGTHLVSHSTALRHVSFVFSTSIFYPALHRTARRLKQMSW